MLQQYERILVPVDGSKEAELAFQKAVAVAMRNGEGTELRLVHVVDTRAFQNISSFDISTRNIRSIKYTPLQYNRNTFLHLSPYILIF